MYIRFKTYNESDAFCDPHCFNKTTKNFTICDEQTYIDCALFPKTILDIDYLIPVTLLLVCMFLTGFFGNLSVCTVILKHPAMRTETNFYLFSLAVSDLLLLIFGLVPELYAYWQSYPYIFGGIFCKLHKFLCATGTWASVMTIVAFSIERYLAVCHPLRSRCLGKQRVGTVIFAIWAMSTLIALPNLHAFQITMKNLKKYNGTLKESLLSKSCVIPESVEYASHLHFISVIVLFFIPLVILVVVYIKIWLTLSGGASTFFPNLETNLKLLASIKWTNSKMARNCGIQNNCAENKRIVKVLVAVVFAFFVCGAPFHFQRIFARFEGKRTREDMVRDRIVLVATGVFYYISATINPILYNAMSKRYRKAFMETIWLRSRPTSQDGTLMIATNATKTSSIKK